MHPLKFPGIVAGKQFQKTRLHGVFKKKMRGDDHRPQDESAANAERSKGSMNSDTEQKISSKMILSAPFLVKLCELRTGLLLRNPN